LIVVIQQLVSYIMARTRMFNEMMMY